MGALDTNEGSVVDDAIPLWVPIPEPWASVESKSMFVVDHMVMTRSAEWWIIDGYKPRYKRGLGFRGLGIRV